MINISNKTKIILAMVFLLFDLNLDAGNISFNIFPSFIGFFLLYSALTSLEKKSQYFGTLRTYSFAMSFLFAAVYLLNMFGGLNYIYAMMLSGKEDNATYVSGLTVAFRAIQLAMNMALTLMVLYAVYLLVRGYKDITDRQDASIERYGKQLFNTFQIYTVLKGLYILAYILYVFVPGTLAAAPAIFTIGAMIPSVVLIMQINKSYCFISD